MPVAARLSKLFYERLGEQIANELVDWFNAVDETNKAELREINELNFARFDARVEQRFTQFELRFAQFEATMERKFAEQTRFMYLAWATILAAVVAFR